MKCSKCGTDVQNDWEFCPNCHNKLGNEVVPKSEEKYIPSEKEKIIFWLSLICVLLPIVNFILDMFLSKYLNETIRTLMVIFGMISPAFYIVAFILLNIGKTKYPRNKNINLLLKILVRLFIGLIILFITCIIVATVVLYPFLESCRSMG